MVENFKYAGLTEQIIGCAMRVHRHLGGGNFNEVFYQRALTKELCEKDMKAVNEKEMPVFYKGEIIGKKRLDL